MLQRDRSELMLRLIRASENPTAGATGRGQVTLYLYLRDEIEQVRGRLDGNGYKPGPFRITWVWPYSLAWPNVSRPTLLARCLDGSENPVMWLWIFVDLTGDRYGQGCLDASDDGAVS